MLPNVMCRVALVVGVSVVVLAGAQPSYSQGFQGGLRGSIRDAGGGVPGAAVTLTNENTNLARATITNGQGEYAFAAVEPGIYRVKVTLTGFKTIERAAVRIGTQSFLILDLDLEVGSIEESITVSGQTPLIETANASHGTVLDRTMLETLPAPGRAAFLMAVSIPTVIASGDGQFNRQQDQSNASLLSLGGGPRRGNNYTIDGVAITDILNRAVANPTMEALDDVKVQVHTYDAEMGRTGGGVFNTTMRSGTNMFRGSGLLPDASALGTGEQLLQRARRPAEARERLLPRRRRRRRSDHAEQDVLLLRRRELSRHPVAQRLDRVSDRGGARAATSRASPTRPGSRSPSTTR